MKKYELPIDTGKSLFRVVPAPPIAPGVSALEQLLVEGGDARIALDPHIGLNRYGCQATPDTGLMAFGSSTASVISPAGFAAAAHVRQRLLNAAGVEPPAVTYERELNRIRLALLRLCALADLPDLDVIFGASGTDLHAIASQLAGGTASLPARVIMAEAAETGSGVSAALAGRAPGPRAAQEETAPEIRGCSVREITPVALRLDDGTPREMAAVDAEVESLVRDAVALGRRVLLILVDHSKTGMIAPSLACVAALHRRWPETVEVLVDACQFRIAPSTLRAYLEQGFMVALTGSKFLTGPTFSGALLIPAPVARRLRGAALPRALRAYSARAEWPACWAARDMLDNASNFGLLLRWEAALEELRAFHAVPEAAVAAFLRLFAQAVLSHLRNDPSFELLPVPPLDRRPLVEATSWDHIQTVFPFLLYRPASHGGKVPLSREETVQVYRLLQGGLAGQVGSRAHLAPLRFQLGQPVACGSRDGVPVSALRLCASARLIVEATAQAGRNAAAVIERALAALDKTALLARTVRPTSHAA